jgi:uncharacterized BrkB/YihY/UPF0761 family membrane protein
VAVLRRIPRELIRLVYSSGVLDEAPALSWFFVTSLVPLALGLTALATLLIGDAAQAERLGERIAQVLPKDIHAEVTNLILRTRRDSPLLIIGSIVVMIWTSSGAVGVLARCLRRVAQLPSTGLIRGKVRNIGIAGAVALLIVLMVLAASAGTGLVHELKLPSLVTRIGLLLISVAITIVICAAVLYALADGALGRRAALAGGVVAGIVLQLTPTVAGYYLRIVAGGTPVELFLILAGVLATCYIASLGLLLGAAVAGRVHLGLAPGDMSRPKPS